MNELTNLINTYGFPIVAAGGMAYMIYFVWKWSTQEVRPAVKEANTVLIALIDRIRMLDNDLIRLTEKIDVATEIQHHKHRKAPRQD